MGRTMTSNNANGSIDEASVEPFSSVLARTGLDLLRGKTTTLQINVGLLCNQACRHCHLEAGPDRPERMDLETCNQVIAFARRTRFEVIDITGGAPELNPNLETLIERSAALAPRVMLRSNLTAIREGDRYDLVDICRKHSVEIVVSFPSLNRAQMESQRGSAVFEKSISAFKLLNSRGYGCPGSGLTLDLVMNATGAFLPPSQAQTEERFRTELERKWGVSFNHLYTFANVPLGRFRWWLERSGNFQSYMRRLAGLFNPCTIDGLMCRSLLSVSWDGYLFDCDFNQAAGISIGGKRTHITEIAGPPLPGSPIAVADHCYACTAGSGFT